MWIGFISGAGSCLRLFCFRDCGSDYLILLIGKLTTTMVRDMRNGLYRQSYKVLAPWVWAVGCIVIGARLTLDALFDVCGFYVEDGCYHRDDEQRSLDSDNQSFSMDCSSICAIFLLSVHMWYVAVKDIHCGNKDTGPSNQFAWRGDRSPVIHCLCPRRISDQILAENEIMKTRMKC